MVHFQLAFKLAFNEKRPSIFEAMSGFCIKRNKKEPPNLNVFEEKDIAL